MQPGAMEEIVQKSIKKASSADHPIVEGLLSDH